MDSRTLILLALVACGGPRPTVENVSVAAGPPGMQRVSLVLHNQSRGHGEVDLQVTLHDAAGRQFKASQQVDLGSHETIQVSVDVRAPSGVYAAAVKPVYPD